jgi:hypothetical protein
MGLFAAAGLGSHSTSHGPGIPFGTFKAYYLRKIAGAYNPMPANWIPLQKKNTIGVYQSKSQLRHLSDMSLLNGISLLSIGH